MESQTLVKERFWVESLVLVSSVMTIVRTVLIVSENECEADAQDICLAELSGNGIGNRKQYLYECFG